ncbi:MAG: hypothetical protein DWP97_14305 [Calditrichaeota bacterium]|nr:MAG: hypothetical protein DWP97_14305 [Calditrichota bacterium]
MTPAQFRWGMILIQIGLLILLRNLNILNDSFWDDLFVFFPVVLIAVGIEKIFNKSKLQFISYLTTVCLFFGGFLIAFTYSNSAFNDDPFTKSTYYQRFNDSIENVQATLNLETANLTIRDSGEDIIFCEFDELTRKPDIEYDDFSNGVAAIRMDAKENEFFGGAVKIHSDQLQDWYIEFSDKLPLRLECNGYDNDLHLNLSTTMLEKLNLKTQNSAIYLKLGTLYPDVKINIVGDESRLRLRVPKEIGLKIFGSDFEALMTHIGLTELEDGIFINEMYDSSATKVEVELDDRLESFSLDYF